MSCITLCPFHRRQVADLFEVDYALFVSLPWHMRDGMR